MQTEPRVEPALVWPPLDEPGWLDTAASLTLWGQLVGKTRLAFCPLINHWWNVTLYVSARGLTTSPMPTKGGVFDIELDFVDHQLVARNSDGAVESMPLRECQLSNFYGEYMERLRRIGVEPSLIPFSVEMPERVQLDKDARTCHYDPVWANHFFRALVQADRVLKQFRGQFLGKASPVHFFWGAFDLATTRFSGRPAPKYTGGIPNVGAWVMQEAYSQEVSSAGFWPGDARFPEAAFYSYAYPEPSNYKDAAVRPAEAYYDPKLGEFLLPYQSIRGLPDPGAAILEFLESTYVAAAKLSQWDRRALERPTQSTPR